MSGPEQAPATGGCAPPGSGPRCRRCWTGSTTSAPPRRSTRSCAATGEGIGLTTVYRTLQTLADGGEVDVLRTGSGEAVYRRCATAHHHHHLVCRRCGATVEIEGPAVETLGAAGRRRARLLRAQPHRGDLRPVPGVRRRADRRPSQIDTSGCRPRRLASAPT